ncbi:PREDICTED: F-box/kelch-repeat protein At3g06240-like [Nicotiana attenuata]|uniref:F-box/kelch-repeat protein At3g06240-like n=1 Tax=Nicotiana attenuata TaxID=49451 RepID=UPI000904B180|nr:PREDICTED: F-box/kelch-repeat protein At3g06240-like [Nicotiana attenuata]
MAQHPKQRKPIKHSRFPSTSVQDSSFKIPILPAELITEILLRLPEDSLLRFRCVSKSWLALISSPEFVKAHLYISANNKDDTHRRLMMNFESITILKIALGSLFNESVIEAFDLDYPTKSNGSYMRLPNFDWIVGSVNGLICLAMEDNDLVMWNPSIRMYKKLPDSRPRLKEG